MILTIISSQSHVIKIPEFMSHVKIVSPVKLAMLPGVNNAEKRIIWWITIVYLAQTIA